MKIIRKLFGEKNIPVDNVELASQLFNTQVLGNGINPKYIHQVNKILKSCTPKGKKYPERQQVLLKVIELIGEPQNAKERFLVAKSYAWSRVSYRDSAIHYLKIYLNNPLYTEAYIHAFHNYNDSLEKRKLYHLSEMYGYLGKAYIGKYEFNKALLIYEYMISIFPEYPPSYMGKYEVLIKQNKLLYCKNWLINCKSLPYYKLTKQYGETENENWFHFTITRLLNDIEEKIKNGYVYRPRKVNK